MSEDQDLGPRDPEQRAELLKLKKDNLRYIGDWLRHRGLRQKDIAMTLGVSEGTVSRYLSGRTFMTVGALRKIAVLVNAHEGDIFKPPAEAGLGAQVELTLQEMDRLGPDQWAKLLEIAKGMRGKAG